VQPIFEKLGVSNINNEPYLDRLSRTIAVRWACYVGSEECQTATTDRVKDYIATDRVFESDNRNTIFCAGMRGADETVFMGLWNKMQASTVPATRNMLIDAMACSQDVELLKVILGTLIAQTGVNYSAAEKTRIIAGIAGSGIIGTETVLAFIDENQVAVKANIVLGATLNNMANWISNEEHLTQVSFKLNFKIIL
jgi:aminopeptidase N